MLLKITIACWCHQSTAAWCHTITTNIPWWCHQSTAARSDGYIEYNSDSVFTRVNPGLTVKLILFAVNVSLSPFTWRLSFRCSVESTAQRRRLQCRYPGTVGLHTTHPMTPARRGRSVLPHCTPTGHPSHPATSSQCVVTADSLPMWHDRNNYCLHG